MTLPGKASALPTDCNHGVYKMGRGFGARAADLGLDVLVGEQRHEGVDVAPSYQFRVLVRLRAELGLRHKLAIVYPLRQRLRTNSGG